MPRTAGNGDVTESDLISIGYSREEACRIVLLLSEDDVLSWYLNNGKRKGCLPVTRVSDAYPQRLRKALGMDCPGCLWAKGDLSFLTKPMISLVGSRDLKEENLAFAVEAGKQAAAQGYILVSGNARGADRVAQDACLASGGQVISVVADRLESQAPSDDVLYLSEDSFDSAFSAQRALSRNRVIHALSNRVLVAQTTYGKGGTWDGTTKNLRYGWSGVHCFDDGSRAAEELSQMGANPITIQQLSNIDALAEGDANFL